MKKKKKLFRLAQLMKQRGRGRMIAKVKKMFELLSRKYSLLSSLLFSYLNNSNEECECNEMDHGRKLNNHERAEERGGMGNVQIVNARRDNNAGLFTDNS